MLKNVQKHLKPLACTNVQAYFSSDFQIYHLLEWILQQTDCANLFITTFSVSEEFIRKLEQLRDKGMISQLGIITDHRTAVKALRLSLFTNNISEELLLGNNHAKVLLIQNDNWSVSVITSQNLTRGNRIECGMVCTMPEIYNQLIKAIAIEKKKMIDANEIFSNAN